MNTQDTVKKEDTVKKYNFQNFSFLGKEVATKRKLRIKSIDLPNGKIVAENRDKEIKEYSLSEVRILAYTRMKDVNKRKIYEGSYVELERKNEEKFEGIVIFRNGWGVLNLKTKNFKKFINGDKITKLIKK